MDQIKILRHLEEKAVLVNGERDNHILPGELDRIPIFCNSILSALKEQGKDKVSIFSSQRIRSIETTEAIVEGVAGIHMEEIVDCRIDALHHGKYLPEITDQTGSVAKLANKFYIRETFGKGNIYYRHGDPMEEPDGTFRYPELLGKFAEIGENQIELSYRYYTFLLDLLSYADMHPNNLLVLSTHSVIILRVLGLMRLAETPFSFPSAIVPGEIYDYEHDQLDAILDGVPYSNFFPTHEFMFDIDHNKLAGLRELIENEVEVIKAQYLQHYGVDVETLSEA